MADVMLINPEIISVSGPKCVLQAVQSCLRASQQVLSSSAASSVHAARARRQALERTASDTAASYNHGLSETDSDWSTVRIAVGLHICLVHATHVWVSGCCACMSMGLLEDAAAL